MLIILVLLVFTGGTSTYRVPHIITEEEADVVLKREDGSTHDPIELTEGEETDVEEGDIKISELMKDEEAQRRASIILKRNAQRNHRYLWMSKIIPYEIDAPLNTLNGDKKPADIIRQAMDLLQRTTCLQFVPKTSSHLNWIRFIKASGCWSYVGKQFLTQGPQDLSIGIGCDNLATVVHEVMHALGFYHEQSRPDRDSYVEIFWENIISGKEFNFARSDSNLVDTLGIDYDYFSILHYKPNFFSENGKNTITAINDPDNLKKIGKGDNLTASDILKINSLYSCNASCVSKISAGAEYGGSLANNKFTSKSTHDLSMYSASYGRLKGGSAWCTLNEDDDEYLQVDLGQETTLCSISTQGSNIYDEWVTQYSLRYSSDGQTFSQIPDIKGEKIFHGNTDKSSIVEHSFGAPISTRYVRFYPKDKHNIKCMRIGLSKSAPYLSAWSSWSPCNLETKNKERQRFCSSDNKNVDCPNVNQHGVETEIVACTHAELTAPIHGHWNRWSAWNSCVSCGLGTRSRSRECTDPTPKNGGNDCVGSKTMSYQCRTKHCGMGPNGCSFSSGMCSWKVSDFGDIPWNRIQYATKSSGTGPSQDHTSPDSSGFYIYLEASWVPTGSKAILRSPVQPGLSSQRCLKFYYHMYESRNKPNYMGTLNVKTQNALTGDYTLLKTISGNKGNQWHQAEVTYTSTSDYMIVFEGIRGTQYLSDIGLDDIFLVWGPCSNPSDVNPQPSTTPAPLQLEEKFDFESGFGAWKNVNEQDHFDWLRHTQKTPSPQTGPSGDHTTRSGYYAYIETSSPRAIGDRARLVSKKFPKEFRCLSFWYHMNGVDVWQLNVYKNTASKEILLWAANRNKQNHWLHGIIPLADSNEFNIIIEGVRGRSYKGDIAIDDITLSKEPCSAIRPLSSAPALNRSCTFDGLTKQCSWINLPDSDIDWISGTNATYNPNTGPSADSSGSGYYMYMNSAVKSGSKASLASPYISPGLTGQCFKFRYHMYGNNVGSLSLYKENMSASGRTQFFTKTGSQGNAWHHGSFHLTGNDHFRVVIQGVVGGVGESDIAIDDVSFTDGSCPKSLII